MVSETDSDSPSKTRKKGDVEERKAKIEKEWRLRKAKQRQEEWRQVRSLSPNMRVRPTITKVPLPVHDTGEDSALFLAGTGTISLEDDTLPPKQQAPPPSQRHKAARSLSPCRKPHSHDKAKKCASDQTHLESDGTTTAKKKHTKLSSKHSGHHDKSRGRKPAGSTHAPKNETSDHHVVQRHTSAENPQSHHHRHHHLHHHSHSPDGYKPPSFTCSTGSSHHSRGGGSRHRHVHGHDVQHAATTAAISAMGQPLRMSEILPDATLSKVPKDNPANQLAVRLPLEKQEEEQEKQVEEEYLYHGKNHGNHRLNHHHGKHQQHKKDKECQHKNEKEHRHKNDKEHQQQIKGTGHHQKKGKGHHQKKGKGHEDKNDKE